MSGQIFISYRRDDEKFAAGRLYDRLSQHFPKDQIFFDVENINPGADFHETIILGVDSCDVLVAVMGRRWLNSSDEEGKQRLDKPDDFVRLEIANALKRNLQVIPVLVDGASMPRSSDLPHDLKQLARRNAVDVTHNHFNADVERLKAALERDLEKADAKRKQEKERLETDRPQKEAEEALLRGNIGFLKGQSRAISNCTVAIELNPNYAVAYYRRGNAYLVESEYDKAITDYTESIRLDPKYPEPYNGLGNAYKKQGDIDKAGANFAKAAKLKKAGQ